MDEKQEQSVVNQQEAANENPKITPEFIDQLAKDEGISEMATERERQTFFKKS